MINSEYESSAIEILEPPAPAIIDLLYEESEDIVSFEFTKNDKMDIFPSLPELISISTWTTSFSVTTSTVPPPIIFLE